MQSEKNREVHPRPHATEETFYRGPESPPPLWRRLLPIVAVIFMLLLIDAVYAFIQMRTELESARRATTVGRHSVVEGDLVAAERAFGDVEDAARSIHGLLGHPGVRLTRMVPLFRGDVETAEALADVAELSQRAGRLAIEATVSLGGVERDDFAGTLFSGGKVQLAPIEEAASFAAQLQELLRQAEFRLAEPKPPYLDTVQDALDAARREVEATAEVASGGNELLRLLPELFGAAGPRRYFLAFMSPSEGRGGGGLLGMYAILTADRGALKLGKIKPFGTFDLDAIGKTSAPQWFKARYARPLAQEAAAPPSAEQVQALLPPGTDPRVAEILTSEPGRAEELLEQYPQAAAAVEQFRSYSSLLTQVNFSPAFDVVGETILELYERDKQLELDGVMTFDPLALAKLTEATGPLMGKGLNVEVGPTNAVEVALLDTYLELGDDPKAQIRYSASLVRDMWQKLTSGETDAVALLGALGESMNNTHVRLYARSEEVANSLSELGVSPDLSSFGNNVQLVYHNSIGTRVDYFLQRDLETDIQLLAGGAAEVSTRIELHNSAPDGPPNLLLGPFTEGDPPGLNRMQLNALLPIGASPTGFEVEGTAVGFDRSFEDGFPTIWDVVEIPPGETRTVEVSYTVPNLWETNGVGGSALFTFLPQATPRFSSFTLTVEAPPGLVVEEIVEPAGSTEANGVVKGLIQGPMEIGISLAPST